MADLVLGVSLWAVRHGVEIEVVEPVANALAWRSNRAATRQELAGEKIFNGKGRCAECHSGGSFLDHQMHDLQMGRFYDAELINGHLDAPEGPIKTFTLRGIKDSPPYLHDGRLLTLEDTVEFFNLVLGLRLDEEEKRSLVAYMLAL